MTYRRPNIDRSIITAQFDLRGFWDALGFRHDGVSPKMLDALVWNVTAFAAYENTEDQPTDDTYVSVWKGGKATYEDLLAMCTQLHNDCDLSQQEAIQIIIQDILKMHAKLTEEVADGTRKESPYLVPIDNTTPWGRLVLALMEAFEVEDAETRKPVWSQRERQTG